MNTEIESYLRALGTGEVTLNLLEGDDVLDTATVNTQGALAAVDELSAPRVQPTAVEVVYMGQARRFTWPTDADDEHALTLADGTTTYARREVQGREVVFTLESGRKVVLPPGATLEQELAAVKQYLEG